MTDSRLSPLPGLDVVVVTYRPGKTLDGFLDSLPQAGSCIASVTVVDSASPDTVAEDVAQARGLTFVGMESNGGYGTSANAGAWQGDAEWIAICNADLLIHPGAFDELIARAQEDDRVGSMGPRILETDGTLYPSARPLPNVLVGAGHALFSKVWPANPWTKRYRVPLDVDAPFVDAGWLSGSCVLVRRDLFTKLGGFDESYFMFFEDVDLGRRISDAGFVNRWFPQAIVTHAGGESYKSDPTPMIHAHHSSAKKYLRSAYPHWYQAPLRGALRVGLNLREKREVTQARRNRAD